MPEYLNFELRIAEGAEGRYPLTVLHSPAGETSGTMHFPFDTLALENKLQAIELALLKAGSIRRNVSLDDRTSVSDFGVELFDALMVDSVQETFRRSLDRARDEGKGLRLQLRIDAPEMAVLPWEFLFDPKEEEFVCLSTDTPLVRYLAVDRPTEPLTVAAPLSILGMIASPADRPALDVEGEKAWMERAIADLRADGLFTVTWVEGSSWRDLQRELRRGTYHLFHFVGHGGFDQTSGEGVVAFADDAGLTQLITGHELGRLLADHQSLRLVVLNSCLGAKGSADNLLSGTASVLVRRGVPAVIAMQYEISDTAAVEFSRSLYEAIADEMPVDAAVAEARKSVSLKLAGTVEWGTPVLFMRSPDGILFRFGERPADERADRAARRERRTTRATEVASAGVAPASVTAASVAPASVAVDPDRWDALACATLSALGVLAWITWGRGSVSASEMWLWGAVLVPLLLCWWFGRRASLIARTSGWKPSLSYLARRSAIVLLIGGVWGGTAWRNYRVPIMPTADAILVARFPGDPENVRQSQMVSLLKRQAGERAPFVPRLRVEKLPRRPTDLESARRYGMTSGAAAVVWASDTSISVEFMERPGVLQSARTEVARDEFTGGPERLVVSADKTVVPVLAGLLEGFASYRAANDSAGLRRASDVLSTVLQDSLVVSGSGPTRRVRSMLYFLRGNASLRRGVIDSARADFLAAVEESTVQLPTAKPTFVEALNNLALISWKYDSVLVERGEQYDSALVLLDKARDVCTPLDANAEGPPFACRYLDYQRGSVRLRQRRFADAESLFRGVASGTSARPGVLADELLIAMAYQNLSFAQVQLAGDPTVRDAGRLLDEAATNGAMALRLVRRALPNESDVQRMTDRWAITGVRILLARGKWQQARDSLEVLRKALPDVSVVYFLEAAALHCMQQAARPGDTQELEETMDLMQQGYSTGDTSGADDYDRITQSCSHPTR